MPNEVLQFIEPRVTLLARQESRHRAQNLITDVREQEMKKAGTYYLILTAVLHAIIGSILLHLDHLVFETMRTKLEGAMLPSLTKYALRFHTWPFLVTTLCLILGLIGISNKLSQSCMMHCAFWIVVASIILCLATTIGFVLPFLNIVVALK